MPTLADLGFDEQTQDQIVTAYGQGQKNEEAAIAQHQQYAEKLRMANAAASEKQEDINFVQRFNTMMSPDVPKPARGYLYKEMARSLNIDPSSATAKDIGAVLQGLDPQSAQLIKSMMTEQLQNSSPGAVRKLAAGILNGQVPMDQVVRQAQAAGQRAAAQTQQDIGASQQRVEAVRPPAAQGQVAADTQTQPSTRTERPTTNASDIDINPAGALPNDRVVAPELLGVIGGEFDPRLPENQLNGQPAARTYGQLAGQGYSRLPSDPEAQRKLAAELARSGDDAMQTLKGIRQLHDFLNGRPEAIGPVGFGTRAVDYMVSQWDALKNSGLIPEGESLGAGTIALGERMIRNIVRAHGLPDNAQTAARISSIATHLAYSIARRNDPGGRLSEPDVRAAWLELGQRVSSPETFQSVLRDVAGRVYEGHTGRVSATTGRRTEMNLSSVSDQELRQLYLAAPGPKGEPLKDPETGGLLTNPATPPALLQAARNEMELRRRLQTQPAAAAGQEPAAQPPAGQSQQAPPGSPEAAQEKRRKLQQEEIDRRRSQEDRAERRADQSMEVQREHLRISQENLELARERFEDTKSERDKAKLQKAFEAFGRAIGADVSVSSPRRAGIDGAQDASAFKLPGRSPARAPSTSRAQRGEGFKYAR